MKNDHPNIDTELREDYDAKKILSSINSYMNQQNTDLLGKTIHKNTLHMALTMLTAGGYLFLYLGYHTYKWKQFINHNDIQLTSTSLELKDSDTEVISQEEAEEIMKHYREEEDVDLFISQERAQELADQEVEDDEDRECISCGSEDMKNGYNLCDDCFKEEFGGSR